MFKKIVPYSIRIIFWLLMKYDSLKRKWIILRHGNEFDKSFNFRDDLLYTLTDNALKKYRRDIIRDRQNIHYRTL